MPSDPPSRSERDPTVHKTVVDGDAEPTERADERGTDLLHRSPVARAFFLSVGFVSLGLGIVGAFVPVLPTTVFVLIAAYCFARSSQRFYTALLSSQHFGPTIRDWQTHRCISRQSKTYAIALIVLSFGLTTSVFVDGTFLRVALIGFAAALVWYLARLPTCGQHLQR